MGEWTIGEVARAAELRPSAIRYYERAGLVPRAARRNGRRVFDDAVFARLALIALAQDAGFTLGEIRTLLHGFSRRTPPPVRWRRLAERKRAELDERIAHARRMQRVLARLSACACPTLDDCGEALRRAGRRAAPSRRS